jgi:hypothetical protein
MILIIYVYLLIMIHIIYCFFRLTLFIASSVSAVWPTLYSYFVPLVRKRTIPTERSPLVSEVTATYCG